MTLLTVATVALMVPAAAQQSGETVSCVDFGRQRIWLRGASLETLTLPIELGSVFVRSVSVETGDSGHNGSEIQPGERVTATIGGATFGPTEDIPDNDPTFRTQAFAVQAQLLVTDVVITHAPVVAPDSVEVGLVCITWSPTAPVQTTTTAPPPTTTSQPPTSTTPAPTTTLPTTTTSVVSGPVAVSQPPTTTISPAAPEIEGAQQLAFTGTTGTMLMLAAGLVMLDLGYMFWSSTKTRT